MMQAGHLAIEPVIIITSQIMFRNFDRRESFQSLFTFRILSFVEMGLYTYLRVLAETTVETESGGERRLIGDELTFRKTIQDALARAFGVSGAGTYVDVLRFRSETINPTDALAKDSGRTIEDTVIRVAREDAPRIKAALASSLAPVRLSVVDESTFLPALLASVSSPLP
ncbi:hypothetical protein ACEPAG_9524 [Sanghuangporus baumii]